MGALSVRFFDRRPFRGGLCSNWNAIFCKNARIWTIFLHFPLPSGLQSNIFGYSKINYLSCDWFSLFEATVRKFWPPVSWVARISPVWKSLIILLRLGGAPQSQKSLKKHSGSMPFSPIWLWSKPLAPTHCASIFEKNWWPYQAPIYR